MSGWHTPAFDTLPDAGQGYRWVGSRIKDAEEYRIEGWRCRSKDAWEGLDTDTPRRVVVTYWEASVKGMNDYSRLRAGQKAQRKRQWAEREAEEQGYTDWVNSLTEKQR